MSDDARDTTTIPEPEIEDIMDKVEEYLDASGYELTEDQFQRIAAILAEPVLDHAESE